MRLNRCSFDECRLQLASLGLLLAACILFAVEPARADVTVEFAQAGSYSVWVATASGTISHPPINPARTNVTLSSGLDSSAGTMTLTTRSADINIPGSQQGDIVYVLDLATGLLAAVPVSFDADGNVQMVIVQPSSFRKFLPEVTADIKPSVSTSIISSGPPADDNWQAPLITFFFGVFLTVALYWAVRRLAQRQAQTNAYTPDPESATTRAVRVQREGRRRSRDAARASLESTALATKSLEITTTKRTYRVARLASGQISRSRRSRATAYLVGTAGLVSGTRFALRHDRMVLGRDGENEIVIEDGTVSRRHALIERMPTGAVSISDYESSNGIWVNGQRIQTAMLKPGDEVKIGDNHFRFEAEYVQPLR